MKYSQTANYDKSVTPRTHINGKGFAYRTFWNETHNST